MSLYAIFGISLHHLRSFSLSLNVEKRTPINLLKKVLINTVQLFGHAASTFGIDLQIESHL